MQLKEIKAGVPEGDTIEQLLHRQLAKKPVEGQTIIHFSIMGPCTLRVWKNTFLVGNNGKTYKMMHAANISMYPKWTHVDHIGWYTFTLFFEPLEKHVTSFSVVENIPESGGFFVDNILRNSGGVYRVKI
jgi:hypothetical protein